MPCMGIAITGTSASGKSTIARRLTSKDTVFRRVLAVTTRERRPDDQDGEFEYITKDEFAALEKAKQLVVSTRYRSEAYGIRSADLERTSGVPVMIVSPTSIGQIGRERRVLSFFLDATDAELDRRLAVRGESLNKGVEKQRQDDREREDDCTYSLVNGSAEDVCELIKKLWDYRDTGGLLPKDMIDLMMRCENLILGGDLKKVTGAAYDLSLGDEYYYNGKSHTLTDQDEFIKIEPHEYVLVRAREMVNMPRDIGGRFGIKVGLFLQGLIQSNGPQVDPGFGGVLWCLLYNTSGDVVQIKRGEHYSTMEFCKLLSPTSPYEGPYQDKNRIMQYLPKVASRSPIKKLQDDIDSLKAEKLWSKVWPSVIAGIIAIGALAVAILSFASRSKGG